MLVLFWVSLFSFLHSSSILCPIIYVPVQATFLFIYPLFSPCLVFLFWLLSICGLLIYLGVISVIIFLSLLAFYVSLSASLFYSQCRAPSCLYYVDNFSTCILYISTSRLLIFFFAHLSFFLLVILAPHPPPSIWAIIFSISTLACTYVYVHAKAPLRITICHKRLILYKSIKSLLNMPDLSHNLTRYKKNGIVR